MSERKEYWQNVVQEAERDLRNLREERREREIELQDLNLEIVKLERLLSSLLPLTTEEPSDSPIRVEGVSELELADAIREVLKQSAQYRTPRGVRDSLRVSGYDLDQHPNALASIHGVLKRMSASGEIEQLDNNGKTYYRWKSTRPEQIDIMLALRDSLRPVKREREVKIKKRG